MRRMPEEQKKDWRGMSRTHNFLLFRSRDKNKEIGGQKNLFLPFENKTYQACAIRYNVSSMDIAFLKKFSVPKFSFSLFKSAPERVAGIDIGLHSTKVVELRHERERAILQTYGELKNQEYFQQDKASSTPTGLLRLSDDAIASLLGDLLREARVQTRDVVFSVPATASFITLISFPGRAEKEIDSAVPYEARKYIPVPIHEVVLDWDVLEPSRERDTIEVILVAVPRNVIEKMKRIAARVNVSFRALEVESFSLARALIGRDQTPTAIISIGHYTTTLVLADKGKVRLSRNFGKGSDELTRALEQGTGVSHERAEAMKRDIGLTERIEEKEIVSIITPLLDALFGDIHRTIELYNRKAPRRIQKINLTGGGSHLKGIVEGAASHFGMEVVRGNPFNRVVIPAFMDTTLRELGPTFAVSVGLALYQITSR